MNRKHLAGLIIVNVVLLVAMAVLTVMPADAQNRARRRGDYMMIASQANGGNSVVYIYDTSNREIIALAYARDKIIVAAPAHNIGADIAKLERIRK